MLSVFVSLERQQELEQLYIEMMGRVNMALIPTVIAAFCSIFIIADCMTEHKFLTSAKIMTLYWFDWIWIILPVFFPSKIGQGFNVGSPWLLYLNNHPTLNKILMFVDIISIHFILFLPFIMSAYLILKKFHKNKE